MGSKNGDPTEDNPFPQNLRRNEQDRVDRIIHGEEQGHYFMLLGAKVRNLLCSSLHRENTNLLTN